MTHDPVTRTPGPVERFVADLAGRRVVWVLLVSIAVALPLAKAFTTKLPAPPAKVRQLPEFTLTNQVGKPFGTDNLRGKLWVANFIFTGCSNICPKLTHAMARVKQRSKNMKGAVQFISFTVDPVHDTPDALNAYVEKNHARGDWSFLTGSLGDVRKLIIGGFKLGMGAHDALNTIHNPDDKSTIVEGGHDDAAELLEIAHGQQFVLVDKDLWIRGFYNPDDDGIDRLMFEIGLIGNLEPMQVTGLDPTVPTAGPMNPATVNRIPGTPPQDANQKR